MHLQTNLTHLLSKADVQHTLDQNENVMLCCGRMGPKCIPVYHVMEELEKEDNYGYVKFVDMLFDLPDASMIRDLPECSTFMGLPFVIYFKKGRVVSVASGIQSREEVMTVLDREFPK